MTVVYLSKSYNDQDRIPEVSCPTPLLPSRRLPFIISGLDLFGGLLALRR